MQKLNNIVIQELQELPANIEFKAWFTFSNKFIKLYNSSRQLLILYHFLGYNDIVLPRKCLLPAVELHERFGAWQPDKWALMKYYLLTNT